MGRVTRRLASPGATPFGKPMAYNTVLTMMRILRNKGFLVSDRQGKVDLCRQVVCRGDSGQRSLCEVTDQGQIEKGVIEDK